MESGAASPDDDESKAHASDAESYFRSGMSNLEQGSIGRAIADFTKAIDCNPNDARAYFNRGRAYFQQRDWDSAIADFTEVIRQDPMNQEAFDYRGLAQQKKVLQRAARHKKHAVTKKVGTTVSASRVAKPDVWPRRSIRRAATTQEAFSESEAKHILADPAARLGWTSTGKSYPDWASGVAAWTEAVRRDTQNAESYVQRSIYYCRNREVDRAIEDSNQAVRLKPTCSKAYQNRGVAWVVKGDYDKAIADLDEAIRLNRYYATAYANRSVAYWAKDEKAKARADLARAQQLGWHRGGRGTGYRWSD